MSGEIKSMWTIGVTLEYVEVVRCQARIENLKALSAAMEAENRARASQGWADAYGFQSFTDVADQLEKVTSEIEVLAGRVRAREAEGAAAAAGGEAEPCGPESTGSASSE